MQTTTFRCGHCNNLMAVGTQYLGQQVQCPTCKQVVVAPPPPTNESPAVPTPNLPLQPFTPPTVPALTLDNEQESIFSTPSSDDLFDDPAPVLSPTMEQPPQPVLQPTPVPNLQLGESDLHQPAETPTPAVHWEPEPGPTEASVQPTATAGWTSDSPSEHHEHEGDSTSQALPDSTGMRKPRAGGQNFLVLFMIPLVSYAIFATLLIFYLWNRIEAIRSSHINDIEVMPDVNGDAHGAEKAKKRSVITWKARDALTLAPLPQSRKVRLGETITAGNLEVTPTRVERKVVSVFVEGFEKSEPCLHESLVLHLKLRNVSTEWAFVPMENSFDRYWIGHKIETPGAAPLDALPLTVLQAGSHNFYGGPAKWLPWRRTGKLAQDRREWLDGRANHDITPLQPGETLETFICTDGGPKGEKIVPTALAQRDLVWRVQLRQGPVAIKGRQAPVPATTVVGVSFASSDVVRAQ